MAGMCRICRLMILSTNNLRRLHCDTPNSSVHGAPGVLRFPLPKRESKGPLQYTLVSLEMCTFGSPLGGNSARPSGVPRWHWSRLSSNSSGITADEFTPCVIFAGHCPVSTSGTTTIMDERYSAAKLNQIHEIGVPYMLE